MAMGEIVITGLGLVTPLGCEPFDVLARVEAGEKAPIARFAGTLSYCPFASVRDFAPEDTIRDEKALRLMSRAAAFAAAAARSALSDARVSVGANCAGDEIALYGSTGTAGMTLPEAAPLVENSAGADGSFDVRRFGEAALKRVRPVLSFKILSNMPVCFVSIFEKIEGPNGVYSPWEGHGAQAIEAGVNAIRCGDAECALVGGCDTKTNEFAFRELEEAGVLDSWRHGGTGVAPAEGAAFLFLEKEKRAVDRGARIYARLESIAIASRFGAEDEAAVYQRVLKSLPLERIESAVIAGDGAAGRDPESRALSGAGVRARRVLAPKLFLGDTFAAAAAVQAALGACVASKSAARRRTLVNCFGHGSQEASLVLESV